MKPFLLSASMLACLLAARAAQASTLYGSQVTATVDQPSVGLHATYPNTQTVGPGVEFPSGSLQILPSYGGGYIIGVNIDVQQSSIDFAYTQTAQALGGLFNGYVFTFSSAPAILSATLDPASSYTSSQVGVSLQGSNEVLVNASGLFITSGSQIIVDLGLPASSAAPEPGTWGLIAITMLPIFLLVRRLTTLDRTDSKSDQQL